MEKLPLGNPEKFKFSHFYLRNFWFLLWFKLWYKDITIIGKEHLDRKTPTILAINHQNTAMDPLVLCGTIFRQITWLARADLYKKKFLHPILHAFKILPIFRQRDGIKSLENNDIVFEKVVEVISAKKLVGLFPEGTHWGFRRLRQTRKGIPKIVILAETKNNYDMDININPVGIYYDDYVSVRSNLFVKIGEPIPMRQFIASMKETPQIAENEIRSAIEDGMRNVMIDIPQMDDTYYTVDNLRRICRSVTAKKFTSQGDKLTRDYCADKKTVEILEQKETESAGFLASLKDKVDGYVQLLRKADYTIDLADNNGDDAFQIIWNSMKIVALFPFFVCGAVLWGGIYLLTRKLGNTLTKDIQFKNSIMFVTSLVMSSLWHTVLVVLWLVFVPLPWWTVFLFFIFLYVVWCVFIDYPRLAKRTCREISFNCGLISKKPQIVDICNKRDEIKEIFSSMIGNL